MAKITFSVDSLVMALGIIIGILAIALLFFVAPYGYSHCVNRTTCAETCYPLPLPNFTDFYNATHVFYCSNYCTCDFNYHFDPFVDNPLDYIEYKLGWQT